MAHRIKAITIS
jgi:hypothetical protein